MRLRSLIGLGSEIGRSRTALGEVAGEDWLDEGAEDDLGAADDNVSLKSWEEMISTYAVWGRDIHKISTNLKV